MQDASLSLKGGTLVNVNISETENGFSGCNSLAAGSTCYPEYCYTGGEASSDGTPFYEADGSNASPVEVDVRVLASVLSPTVTLGEQHMQYQEIIITNTDGSAGVTYGSIEVPSALTNYVHLCEANDSKCDWNVSGLNKTSCGVGGGQLAPNESCSVILKSITTTNQGFATIPSATMTFTATPQGGSPVTTQFKVAQQMALYATGLFNQSGANSSVTLNNIAKWDGKNWRTLDYWQLSEDHSYSINNADQGLNGQGNALAVYKGDLYVGGQFTKVNSIQDINAKYVARWNGSSWSALSTASTLLTGGSSVPPYVQALGAAVNADGINGTNVLYIGGAFTTVGSNSSLRAAQWKWTADAAAGSLQPLGNHVSPTQGWGVGYSSIDSSGQPSGVVNKITASAANNGEVYMAGAFKATSGSSGNNLWRGSIDLWKPDQFTNLGGDCDGVYSTSSSVVGTLYDVFNVGNELYVAGSFSQIASNCLLGYPNTSNAYHVAYFNGSSWSRMGTSSSNNGFSAAAKAIVKHGNYFYAGGDFVCPRGTTTPKLTHIARTQSASNAWSAVAGGLGTEPSNCLSNSDTVLALESYNGVLYAAGIFNRTNSPSPVDTNVGNIAGYDGEKWASVGKGLKYSSGSNVSIQDILVTSSLLVIPQP